MTKHNIVSVSGGKDSTALLLLAIEQETENLQAVFADTGHEHQQTYEYIEYLNDKVFPIRKIRADFNRAQARIRADEVARKGRSARDRRARHRRPCAQRKPIPRSVHLERPIPKHQGEVLLRGTEAQPDHRAGANAALGPGRHHLVMARRAG